MYLEHVNLTVSDLDRSIDFYSRLFDFRVRWRGETSTGLPAAHVGDDRFYVALFQAATPASATNEYDTVGLNHFGIVVDDLDAMKRRMSEVGAEVHGEGDYDPGRRVYLFDPDNIEIELVEYQPAPV